MRLIYGISGVKIGDIISFHKSKEKTILGKNIIIGRVIGFDVFSKRIKTHILWCESYWRILGIGKDYTFFESPKHTKGGGDDLYKLNEGEKERLMVELL